MKKLLGYCILSMLMACGSSRDLININVAPVYTKDNVSLQPDLSVFHFSKDSSRLYLRIRTKEFLGQVAASTPVDIHLRLSYEIINSWDEGKHIDSSSFPLINESIKAGQKYITRSFDFAISSPTSGVMIVKLYNNRKEAYRYYLNLDKVNENNRQYFHAEASHTDYFLTNYVTNTSPVSISYAGGSTSSLLVKYYRRKFDIALPPFAVDKPDAFDYQPDSIFSYNTGQENTVSLSNEGIYHFQPGEGNKEGFTLFRFYEDFPSITRADKLLEPIRYICTQKEYDQMANSSNVKSAVDDFWLEMAGNSERAKELVRKYYSRVVGANKLFTSFKEGWKTDRGIILIIYGTPNIVYKTSNSESWIYGDGSSLLSMTFNFIKVINPFTDNDFELSRGPIYQNTWYSSVDSWRHGRAFNEY